MSVEPLDFLIEELRIQAMSQAARSGITAGATLEWDVADTLSEVQSMLREEAEAGGAAGLLAMRVFERLLQMSLVGYEATGG